MQDELRPEYDLRSLQVRRVGPERQHSGRSVISTIKHKGKKMNRKEGAWDAGRVFQALGRIGYDPVSALLDLVDNSVSAGATSAVINVNEERKKVQRGRPKAVLKSFIIVDNGGGMDEDALHNALTLGSSAQLYHDHTLSKFGMGLKTAASSLGKKLEIISRSKGDLDNVRKVVLDQDLIVDKGKYIYDLTAPQKDDLKELDTCTRGKSGTLIRVTKLHHDSLPRTSEIVEGLKYKAGVIYYYYLKGLAEGSKRLSLRIADQDIRPVDPLFIDEIDTKDGDLKEHVWDGLRPKWITKSQSFQLDSTGSIWAKADITQLPHPPSVSRKNLMSQNECRSRYLIGAGNYGFYIYRNWRLISWADRLSFVPRDQDLYSFRGRLLINSDADDILNIDVTKSRIHLSEIAQDQLKSVIQEAVKKSRTAWQTAHRVTVESLTQNPHDTANQVLNRISHLQADEDRRDEDVAPLEEKKELEQRRTKAVFARPISPEDQKRVNETGDRVLYVDTLNNNQLWERAHDPTHGLIVRVNRSHRFCRDILDSVRENSNLMKIIDVLFFSLARGEYDLVYKSEHDEDKIEKIMEEYRERVGGTLSDVIRRLNLNEFLADV